MIAARSILVGAFGCSVLLLAGCGDRHRPLGAVSSAAPGATVLPGQSSLPVPTGFPVDDTGLSSRLGPLDVLTVSVFGMRELTGDFQIDETGMLQFPLVGAIDTRGLTLSQLSGAIEDGLRKGHVRSPNVSVVIKETVQSFAVEGSVNQPGLYPPVGKLTLLRALARAGGMTEFAKLDRVFVLRNIDGKQYLGVYDVEAIRAGNYADPRIYADDVVIVGDSAARRRFRDIVQLLPAIASPLIVLLTR